LAARKGAIVSKTLHVAVALLVLVAGCTLFRGTYTLRYDGLYMSATKTDSEGEHYWRYLRFYPDGGVITVSSTGKPEDLRPWFSKAHDAVSHGVVTLRGNEISFSGVSSEGTVDYAGEIDGDRLRLNSYSHINDNRETDEYVFVSWQAEHL
jgi:hypothetical protein